VSRIAGTVSCVLGELKAVRGERRVDGVVAIGVLGVAVVALLAGCGSDGPRDRDLASPVPVGSPRSGSPEGQAGSGASPRSTPPSASPDPITPRPGGESGPPVSDAALPGSPEIVLFQRLGDDVVVLGWRPGEPGLTRETVVHDAVRGLSDRQLRQVQLSPDGSLLLVAAAPATFPGHQTFRVFSTDGDGHELWQSTSPGSDLSATFIGARQLLVAPGHRLIALTNAPIWRVIDLSGDEPVVREMDVPDFARPEPSATPDWRTQILNYHPLALSVDGEWLYAMSGHALEPRLRPAFRVAIATGQPEPVDDLPISGPARADTPILDRSSRLLLAGPFLTAGPGIVEAWAPGASAPDFRVDLANVVGASWTDDGRVLTSAYDRLPGPFRFRILSLGADGAMGEAYLDTQGTKAALIGVRDGFAAAYVGWTGSGKQELVVIRLRDGTVARVEIDEPDGLLPGIGLRP